MMEVPCSGLGCTNFLYGISETRAVFTHAESEVQWYGMRLFSGGVIVRRFMRGLREQSQDKSHVLIRLPKAPDDPEGPSGSSAACGTRSESRLRRPHTWTDGR